MRAKSMPPSELRRRLADPARLRTGVAWLIAVALAYAAVIALLAAGGDRPGDLPPWLRIPASEYFWWEALFIGPVILASGLLATSAMYLLARAGGAERSTTRSPWPAQPSPGARCSR